MIALAVVIVFALIRYRKKHNPSSVATLQTPATGVPNNAAAIAAVRKEKELNKDALDNLTYNELKRNDCNILSEHEVDTFPPVPQDNKVPYDNVQYWYDAN